MMEAQLEGFRCHLERGGSKPRGIEEYVRDAGQFLSYLAGRKQLVSEVTFQDAEAYRERLTLREKEDGSPRYHSKTVNKQIAELRCFYRYLVSVGRSAHNPFDLVEKLREGVSVPKNVLTVKQMGRLLRGVEVKSKTDLKFAVVLELLYATGARISEIEGLERKDIRLPDGYIVIRDDKTRRDRYAPLTEYAERLLTLYLAAVPLCGNGLVFLSGKPRTFNRWMSERLARLSCRLGLPRVTCHSIRHTIATQLLRAGAGIRQVQEYLGHERTKNTEVYTRILTEDLKRSVEHCHPRERRAL